MAQHNSVKLVSSYYSSIEPELLLFKIIRKKNYFQGTVEIQTIITSSSIRPYVTLKLMSNFVDTLLYFLFCAFCSYEVK